MRLFRSHRERARLTNRTIGYFFLAMLILLVAFLAVVAGRYLLGVW